MLPSPDQNLKIGSVGRDFFFFFFFTYRERVEFSNIFFKVSKWGKPRAECSQNAYGSEFWTMYNWPFSDLEHFYYTWFAPSYSETISFGVVVKSTIRAFRKRILYIPLLVFVHHTGLQMKKNDKKWCFYTFSFFWNHPVNFQAPLLILSNYSVNLVCLGPVS